MKVNFTIGTLFLLFGCLFVNAKTKLPYVDVFRELENAIAKRDYYLDRKLVQIRQVRNQLNSSEKATEQFEACRTLYKKYYDLKIDTALAYAENMLKLSDEQLKVNPTYKTESLLFLARAYAYTGMYKECDELLKSPHLIKNGIPDELKSLYFLIQLEFNKGMGDHTIVEREIKTYKNRIKDNLDSLLLYTPKNSIWYSIYKSNRLRAAENYEPALKVLYEVYNKLTTEDREMAHVAFYMADLSQLMGNLENEKLFLTVSAIADVKHAVKEYVSLWKLAIILYEEGDIETAHRFIEISLQDAKYSGAYRWMRRITQVLPFIYEAYNDKILEQRNQILTGFLIILCLLGGIFIQYRKLRKAKVNLSGINADLTAINAELNVVSERLNLSNADLKLANSQLVFLNNELVSANLSKEIYLTKFIDLCSTYIDKLDDYRVSLKRLLKGGRLEKIQMELNSTKYIEKEYKTFLVSFDETFLKLYPNFVAEFNSLFQEDQQQELKKNELLTTELRIFALIRLGITDSNKIARFLRCSITTIYTYRSKIKNKSFCPDLFEDRVKEFQRERYLPESVDVAL
uniref:DUF6377 domain-containing protein n=1 Tax=Pedobacter schmidteae TaxID=2201271 RepID=UPI000EB00A1D|nr:DUF6377 domain-containing protein [Pedobacter schmidteae]